MGMAYNGLAKLIEESGELHQVIGKILAYPDTEDHPDQKGNLNVRLIEELADAVAASLFVQSVVYNESGVCKNFFQTKASLDSGKYSEVPVTAEELCILGILVSNIVSTAYYMVWVDSDKFSKAVLQVFLSQFVEKAVQMPKTEYSTEVFYQWVDEKLQRYFAWHEQEGVGDV